MDELQATIREQLGRAGVPGCAIAVTGPGVPIRSFEYGFADIVSQRAVEAATRFHLFSGTKLYTATALMLLAERGDIVLDAPVRDYLPELPLREGLTVRQLASHTSGLPDTLRAFLAVHLSGETQPSTGEALRRYRLNNGKPAGGSARYRNVNYAILGELVARVAGEPYVSFVQRTVLAPLGANVNFGSGASGDVQTAVGYMLRLSPMRLALRLVQPNVARRIYGVSTGRFMALKDYALDTAAIGGLVGSASQFVPLLREMLSGEDGLLHAKSKQEMLTQHARGAAGIVSRDGVGIGWKRGTAGAVTFWNHEGGGAGFCSETRLYPAAALGITILMNRTQTPALSRTCHRICEAIRSKGIAMPAVVR